MKDIPKLQYIEENTKPIYGHYHCKICRCAMNPIKRLNWHTSSGVRELHECPKCGELFIEEEHGT